jgi:hypothetical protein
MAPQLHPVVQDAANFSDSKPASRNQLRLIRGRLRRKRLKPTYQNLCLGVWIEEPIRRPHTNQIPTKPFQYRLADTIPISAALCTVIRCSIAFDTIKINRSVPIISNSKVNAIPTDTHLRVHFKSMLPQSYANFPLKIAFEIPASYGPNVKPAIFRVPNILP